MDIPQFVYEKEIESIDDNIIIYKVRHVSLFDIHLSIRDSLFL